MTATLGTAIGAALPRQSRSTQLAYGRVHRELARWAAKDDLDPVTLRPEQLRQFLADAAAGRSRATVAQWAAALRFVYDAAIAAKLRDDNPAAELRVAAAARSTERVSHQPLDDDVLERVRKAACRLGAEHQLAVEARLQSGVSLWEIARLTSNHFTRDEHGNCFMLRETGTRKPYPRRVDADVIRPVLALYQQPDQRLLSPDTTIPDARYVKKLIEQVRLAARAPTDNLADALGTAYEYRYQQWLHTISLTEREVLTYARRYLLAGLQPLIPAAGTP